MRVMLRWLGASLLGLHCTIGTGCVHAQPSWVPEPGELASDLTRATPQARGQRPDETTPRPPQLPLPMPMPTLLPPSTLPPSTLPTPTPTLLPPSVNPTPPSGIAPPPNPAQLQPPQPLLLPPSTLPPAGAVPPSALPPTTNSNPTTPPTGIVPPPSNLGLPAPPKLPPTSASNGPIQTASLQSRSRELTVVARVNGRPLFAKDIQIGVSREEFERRMQNLPPSLQNEEINRMHREALDDLIDREVAYQEAIRKLQQMNPKALDKLKEFVGQEVDRNLALTRKNNPKVSELELERSLPEMRRRMEREIIASEFLRSKVSSQIQIYFDDVKDYYDTHKQEFQKPANIEWQDIFIQAGTPNRPTVAHCKQFAQSLLKQLGPGDDLTKLIAYDDGPGKLNKARGIGTQAGKIQPAEIEPHLLKLKDGDIGPVIELATGVHIIRLVKHESGSTVPLDEKTQTTIRNTLRRQIIDREIKRVAKELRVRAVVELEPLQ